MTIRKAAQGTQRAKLAAHIPKTIAPPRAQNRLELFRTGGSSEIVVVDGTAEHQVAHRPADESELVSLLLEEAAQFDGFLTDLNAHGFPFTDSYDEER